ncbi:MAG: AI-2E family transporter [Holdemanella sp.]|uniref:AI-2E family transporter n=1 Tax=Holdemanella sp. TaxID=1971762 RepID=UPI0039955C98
MNRNVAGIISVLVLFIVVGGLLTLIVVRTTDTIVDFVSFAPTFYEQSVLPGITKLYNWVLEVGERFDVSIMDAIEQALPGMISNLGSTVTNLSGKIVSGITGIASRLPSILLNSIICLIATVFISVDFDRIEALHSEKSARKTAARCGECQELVP